MLKNTKTKKVLAAVVAFTFALSLVGTFAPAGANAAVTIDTTTAASFTRSLTIGSTGADVVSLQTFLVNNGFLVMPAGVAMGYFGPLTQAAVAAFQSSVGITPAAGYFGPITQAYLRTVATTGGSTGGSTVPGCTSTTGYSPTTGQPCSGGSTSTVPGCQPGYVYSPTTGQPCSGTSTGGTSSTGEGTLTVTQGTPGSNSNIQTNVDTPVYGLQLRAQLGDVRVDRIDLDVNDTISGGSIENPGNFINNIKVWDGTTVLLNRSVSTSDFITGTSSTDYYIRLSGLNFVVPNGTTKTLVVSFSTSGSIDSNRTLTIRGYGASSLLAYSGANNTASYYDISNIVTTQIFQKPGNSTVIFGVDASNPLSQTVYVDPTNGTQLIPLLVFNSNTTQGTATLTQVVSRINSATSSYATGAHLFQGTTELQYQPISSADQTVTFNNLNLSTQGTGNVYSIKVDMPASTNNGTYASATVSSVTYQNSNGNQTTVTPTITGNAQYFYHVSPQFVFQSADYVKTNNTSGNTIAVQANFHFTLTPYPGQAYAPVASDYTVIAKNNSSGTSTTLTSKGITVTPTANNGFLSANQTYTITLTATDSDQAPGATITYYLTSASSTIQDNNSNYVNVTQTWGLDNFHTDPVAKT